MSKCSLFEDFLRISVLFLRRRKRRCHHSPSSIMVQRHNCSIHRHSSSLAALKHIPPSCDRNLTDRTIPSLSTKSHDPLQTLCMARPIKIGFNQVQLPNLSIVRDCNSTDCTPPSHSIKLYDQLQSLCTATPPSSPGQEVFFFFFLPCRLQVLQVCLHFLHFKFGQIAPQTQTI